MSSYSEGAEATLRSTEVSVEVVQEVKTMGFRVS